MDLGFLRFDMPMLVGSGERNYTTRLCAMDMVSFLECEPQISDKPKSVSEYLRQVVICINDKATANDRQKLWPYLPRLVGTMEAHQGLARKRNDAMFEIAQKKYDWKPLKGYEYASAAAEWVLHAHGIDAALDILDAGIRVMEPEQQPDWGERLELYRHRVGSLPAPMGSAVPAGQ